MREASHTLAPKQAQLGVAIFFMRKPTILSLQNKLIFWNLTNREKHRSIGLYDYV